MAMIIILLRAISGGWPLRRYHLCYQTLKYTFELQGTQVQLLEAIVVGFKSLLVSLSGRVLSYNVHFGLKYTSKHPSSGYEYGKVFKMCYFSCGKIFFSLSHGGFGK